MIDWLNDPRWERIAAASGIGAAILFVVSFILAGQAPQIDEGAGAIAEYYSDRGRILWAGVVQGLGSLLFLWFLAALATVLREAGQARLAAATFAGGILTVALGGVGYIASQTLAHSLAGTGDEGAITAVYTLGEVAYGASSFPLALMALAGGTAILRSAVMPTALGWASCVGALWFVIGGAALKPDGFFSPSGGYGMISYFIYAAWMLVVSYALTRRLTATTEAPRPVTAAG